MLARNSKNPIYLLEPLLTRDFSTYEKLNEEDKTIDVNKDLTGKVYTPIKDANSIISKLVPVRYPFQECFGLHQENKDTISNDFVKKKKGKSYVRADYIQVLLITIIKNLEERLNTLENLVKIQDNILKSNNLR